MPPHRGRSMSTVTVRARILRRLPALVLLLSMTPFAAAGVTTAGAVHATMLVAEGTGDEAGPLDALVEPLANPVVEPPIAAAFPDGPHIVTHERTPMHEVLRL